VAYLLKGIVFGNDGRALSPWHTTKKSGRRYRYYVPQRDAKEHAGASGLPRLPAAELESAVLDQLRAILRAPNLLGDIRIQKTGEPDILQTSDGRLTLSVPIQIKRRSGRKLVTLPNGETAPVRPWDVAPTSIQLALARGHRWCVFRPIVTTHSV
jgi:hypothetical protein